MMPAGLRDQNPALIVLAILHDFDAFPHLRTVCRIVCAGGIGTLT
jgi:hypothetical protein